MSIRTLFKHEVIEGKDIYIVDDHHKALAAWALVRRSLDTSPNLITIDHHTDTIEAFNGHSHWEASEGRVGDQESFRRSLVAKIDWSSDASIVEAVGVLRNDEHIDAATRSGTLADAFCIQLSDMSGTLSVEQIAFQKHLSDSGPDSSMFLVPKRPMTYEPTESRIYALSFDCFIGCQAVSHDEHCSLRQADEIVEKRYLDDQLARAAEITKCLGIENLEAIPYILDVDLDVFHTGRAIKPEDPSTLYRLIRNSLAITIATEAEYVDEEWLDEERSMDSRDLLNELLRHIRKALREGR